uniref:Uncharacterized protein n=1 Tax=Anopheles quadriannulatus TaxID=34691 RepID=A0A182X4Z3_ANOQN
MATVEDFRQLLKRLIFYSKGEGVAIHFTDTVFTLIKYSDDTLHMMKVLLTLGTCVQLYVKFIIAHKKASELKLLIDNIEQDFLQCYQN